MPKARRKSSGPSPCGLAVGCTLVLVAALALRWRLPGSAESSAAIAGLAMLTAVAWAWVALRAGGRQVRGKTLAELQALPPAAFEEWTAALFEELGYAVEITAASGDHGIDLIVRKRGETAIVQCKRFKSWSVGEAVLRDLYGALYATGADRAYLVTTGRLTEAARRWAAGKPIEVWEGNDLVGGLQQPAPATGLDIAHASDPALAAPSCPRCGAPLAIRRSRYGGEPFLGCSTYPRCHHTQPLRSDPPPEPESPE